MSFRKFIHNNIVGIVILPTIVGIHFMVDRIQENEKFVAEHEKKDLPIVLAYKALKGKILNPDNLEIENQKDS